MNQKILIVFTLFLLVTILLLLLMSDAKEKSRRIRVLVLVFENPGNTGDLKKIKAFLDKISGENQLLFTMAGEPGGWNEQTSAAYPVLLKILIDPAAETNAIISGADDPRSLQLIAGAPEALGHDPEFLRQVTDTILRIASH